MSLPAIKIENLSKQYRIGEYTGYKTLRETVVNLAKAPFRRASDAQAFSGQRPEDRQTIWALKDVSFEVEPGEVVGIIGRNGAGKSTLLKVISKITEPTKGRIELRGRIGSLLEIGTGFHPELTGHENIYLYGAILGMDRWEVTRKFDEIVAFAELEKFIETPVKRYSSGMYMRLAFAVAAHLETEILLVDEVLAVGDAAFQKKCLGKMEGVSKEGRTVLFVSHHMAAIQQLCQRCLLLDKGDLRSDDVPDKVISEYISISYQIDDSSERKYHRSGTGEIRVGSVELLTEAGEPSKTYFMGQTLKLKISGSAKAGNMGFTLGVQFVTLTETPVLYLYNQHQEFIASDRKQFLIEILVPDLTLMPGVYLLHIWLGRSGIQEFDYVKSAASLEIFQSERAQITQPLNQQHGLVYADLLATQVM